MYPIGCYERKKVLGKEVANANTKRAGESQQVKRGAGPNAAFNSAHVAATNARPVGKCFLRKPLLFAERAESHAKFLQGRMPGWLTGLAGHSPHPGLSRPFGPRPIRYNEIAPPMLLTLWPLSTARVPPLEAGSE